MADDEKFLIGIDDSSRSPVIGSLVIAMVVVRPDFFRKFSFLKVKDGKLLNQSEIAKIIEYSQKYVVDHSIDYVKAKDIDKENLNDLEMKAITELLNKQHKFWKHKIFIDNFEDSKRGFIKRFNNILPMNLANKFKLDKWTIIHGCTKYKVCALASCYAKYYSNIERDDIKSVWGDFGSGKPSDPKTIQFLKEHPDCPHIRTFGGKENG